MAKTYQNIIDEARVLLQDTLAPFRYSTTVLLAKLNRAMQELGRLRPDAYWEFFRTDDILIPEVVVTDPTPDDDVTVISSPEDDQIGLSAAFNLPTMFYGPLVYYVVASAELTDDEYTDDGRASTMLAQFKQQIVSL